MRVTLRWKLLGSYLLLILTLGAVLFGYLSHTLGEYLAQEATAALMSEARVARMAAGVIVSMRRDAPVIAARIAAETRARVTVIARSGEVIADSDSGDIANLENHGKRPEVLQALKEGRGAAIRYSATLRTSMLYVALPFQSTSGETAVLRMALPLSSLEDTGKRLKTTLGTALLLAAVISLLLSSILSNLLSRSLGSIAAAARRIGTGDFSSRIPSVRDVEIGELGTVINDMAGRIEAQIQEMRTEKNRLDAILQGMGEGLIVVDAGGTVSLVNPAFRELFAVTDAVEGKPLITITRHPGLNETFQLLMHAGEEQTRELTISLQEEKVLLTHWVPLLQNGSITGAVAVFHDISDLKRLERMRKDFVANVSHELRTPVTVISGYAETILSNRGEMKPEHLSLFLGKIHEHAERLGALIRDLLTLSELESGKLSLSFVPVAVKTVADRTVGLLEAKARAKELEIENEIGETVTALADPGRLEQVFVNLVDNAINYTSARGRIVLAAEETEQEIKISVSDNGVGISPSDLPRIFERFYRANKARSREGSGGSTGLGLSIVKHIIQIHGGVIDATSEPGRGTTFVFTLRRPSQGVPPGAESP